MTRKKVKKHIRRRNGTAKLKQAVRRIRSLAIQFLAVVGFAALLFIVVTWR